MNTAQIADIIGYVTAGIGIVMFLPQVIKSYKIEQTKDISFLTYILLAVSTFLWVIYGVLMRAIPIILVNTVVCILSILLLFLKRKYG